MKLDDHKFRRTSSPILRKRYSWHIMERDDNIPVCKRYFVPVGDQKYEEEVNTLEGIKGKVCKKCSQIVSQRMSLWDHLARGET